MKELDQDLKNLISKLSIKQQLKFYDLIKEHYSIDQAYLIASSY